MAAGRTVEPNRHVHSLHAYFLQARRPHGPDHLRRRPHPRRWELHHPPRGRDPARAGDLQPGGVVPRRGDRSRPPGPDARRRGARGGRRNSAHDDHDGHEQINRNSAPHVVARVRRAPRRERMGAARRLPRRTAASPIRTPGSRRTARCPTTRCCTCASSPTRPTLTLLGTAMLPHPIAEDHAGFMVASLDHVMWFHRPCRADEWLLYHEHSPSAAGARGFARVRSSAPTACSR